MNFTRYRQLKKVDLAINLLLVAAFASVGFLAENQSALWWIFLITGGWQALSFLLWLLGTPKKYSFKSRRRYGLFLAVLLPVLLIWVLTTFGSMLGATILLGFLLLLVSAYMALWYVVITHFEAFKQVEEL